jgi:hypothetical protein
VLLAASTADAVVELVTDGELPEAFRAFSPERFARAALAIEGGAR